MTDRLMKARIGFSIPDLLEKLGFPPGTRIIDIGFDETYEGVSVIIEHSLVTYPDGYGSGIPNPMHLARSPDGLPMISYEQQHILDQYPDRMAAMVAHWGDVSQIAETTTPRHETLDEPGSKLIGRFGNRDAWTGTGVDGPLIRMYEDGTVESRYLRDCTEGEWLQAKQALYATSPPEPPAPLTPEEYDAVWGHVKLEYVKGEHAWHVADATTPENSQ